MSTAALGNVDTAVKPAAVNGPVCAPARGLHVEPLQRFVFSNVTWREFEAFCAALPERHFRLAYDGSELEIMATSHLHGRLSRLMAQIVIILTDELNMPRQSGGDFTLKGEQVERSIQGDESFYLTNEPKVRNKDKIDLTRDPPPDLAIEIEVTDSVLDRLAIYKKLRVPEVWRFDGKRIQVLQLGADGEYVPVERSRYFPQVDLKEIVAFIQRRDEMDETTLMRSFRAWVQGQIARNWQSSS